MIKQKRNFSCYCEETKKSFASELDGVRNYLTKISSKKTVKCKVLTKSSKCQVYS